MCVCVCLASVVVSDHLVQLSGHHKILFKMLGIIFYIFSLKHVWLNDIYLTKPGQFASFSKCFYRLEWTDARGIW